MEKFVLESIYNEVKNILKNDSSGHGMNHIDRVIRLSKELSKGLDIDNDLVYLIALLHDVDDYKLVGLNDSKDLKNARSILNKYIKDETFINKIIDSINTIGYSKRLDGIVPNILEAQIVSDADMLDAIGALGMIRSLEYNISKNRVIFDENIFPNLNMTKDAYQKSTTSTMINHWFEKLLKLKDMMLTNNGKEMAIKRHNIIVEFLYNFFEEENLTDWKIYLDKYLKEA
jgi:uncharacterized protein